MSPCAPTTTTPPGRHPLRSNMPVSQRVRPSKPPRYLLGRRLGFAIVGVDHDDGRRIMFEDADRGLLVADDRCDGLRQCLDRLELPDRYDVVESRVGQCFQ